MSNETTKKPNVDPGHGDHGGEGNYDAARRYDAGVQRTVREGKTEQLAEQAKEALEGDERVELERAERDGKNARTPDRKG